MPRSLPLLAALILVGCASRSRVEDNEARIKALEARYHTLNAELTTLREEMAGREGAAPATADQADPAPASE